MLRLSLVLVACVVMTGCSTSIDGKDPTVNHPITAGAKDQNMSKCAPLGPVQASSAQAGGWFEGVKTANSIVTAEQQARAMGATNVVWNSNDLQFGNGNAQGQAYKCP